MTRASFILPVVAVLLGIVPACGGPITSDYSATEPTSPAPVTETLLINGIFDAEGDELLQIGPVSLREGVVGRPPPPAQGVFHLEITYVDGTTSVVPFDALIADDSELGRSEHGFFELAAPVTGPVAMVKIVSADNGSVLGEVVASEFSR